MEQMTAVIDCINHFFTVKTRRTSGDIERASRGTPRGDVRVLHLLYPTHSSPGCFAWPALQSSLALFFDTFSTWSMS